MSAVLSHTKLRIGILGGGQLAKMLFESASALGIFPLIYGQSEEDPAVKVARRSFLGSFSDEDKLESFFKEVDLILFENEFIDIRPLKKLSLKYKNVKFEPNLELFESIRDKSKQKSILKKLKIPTSKFSLLKQSDSIQAWLDKNKKEYDLKGFVLKLGLGGYDGKGVLFDNTPDEFAYAFCKNAMVRNKPVYAEEKIKIKQELALVSVRNRQGEFLSYPLVISNQRDGICRSILGPAKNYGVSSKIEKKAIYYAKKIASHLKFTGVFAIEFFLTSKNELLVNEISPRVHNSGHFTQNATPTSQFENHLRAVLGMPLGATNNFCPFGMLNLLWPLKEVKQAIHFPPLKAGLHLHWYGKSEMKYLRKVGHLNLCYPDKKTILKELKEWDRLWVKQ